MEHVEYEWLDELRATFAYDPLSGCLTRETTGRECTTPDKDGYYQTSFKDRNGKRHTIKVHQVAFILTHGYLPETVDHIDMNRNNNRIENLRAASRLEQARNRTVKNGVSFDKNTGKWRARIKDNRGNMHSRQFPTEAMAQKWRAFAEKILWK